MAINELLGQVGGMAGAGAMGMGMNMLDEALFGEKRKRDQIEQQQKFTDMGTAQSLKLMEAQRMHQMKTWQETNYGAQMEQMRQAGLNPAMMYAGGGEGGSTASVTGGSNIAGKASSEAEQKGASMEAIGMGLQMQMQKAQIENIKADTEDKLSRAGLQGEKSKTESGSREILIENMRQAGMGQWFENLKDEAMRNPKMGDDEMNVYRNRAYDTSTAFQGMGQWNIQVTNAIAKTLAETGNLQAQELLANEKAKIMWEELVNATKNANANMIQAKAYELASMWTTGEFTNWKTWTNLATDAVGLVFDGINAVKKPVRANTNVTNNYASGKQAIKK